jgi:hypothetical protein
MDWVLIIALFNDPFQLKWLYGIRYIASNGRTELMDCKVSREAVVACFKGLCKDLHFEVKSVASCSFLVRESGFIN